jgi:prepilin-type N-terminal cleavage/methylation domain-containing protein
MGAAVFARFGRLLRRGRDDAGFSMTEVMVGAAIMSTVFAISAQGFLTMYQASNRAEAAAVAQTALSASMQKLDREIRYAYRINPAFTSGTNFAITYVIPDADTKRICVELTLPQTGGTLLRAQWLQESTNPAGVITTAVANDLVPVAGANPFTRVPKGAVYNGVTTQQDRLQLIVDSNVGLSEKQAKRRYELRFTALNTLDANTALTCTKPL